MTPALLAIVRFWNVYEESIPWTAVPLSTTVLVWRLNVPGANAPESLMVPLRPPFRVPVPPIEPAVRVFPPTLKVPSIVTAFVRVMFPFRVKLTPRSTVKLR